MHIDCLLVASEPKCSIDKPSAQANESVTYTCSVMPVCGAIDVSLTIENDGVVVATDSNNVTWTVMAGDVANSAVSCRSTVDCPRVTIPGSEFCYFTL